MVKNKLPNDFMELEKVGGVTNSRVFCGGAGFGLIVGEVYLGSFVFGCFLVSFSELDFILLWTNCLKNKESDSLCREQKSVYLFDVLSLYIINKSTPIPVGIEQMEGITIASQYTRLSNPTAFPIEYISKDKATRSARP